jgi:deoxyxylulose-5-phosphate synthase
MSSTIATHQTCTVNGKNNIEILQGNIMNKLVVTTLQKITKKGYGLDSAENDPCKFHGIAPASDGSSTLGLDIYSWHQHFLRCSYHYH